MSWWGAFPGSHKAAIKVPASHILIWSQGSSSQITGCWQNSIPCHHRAKSLGSWRTVPGFMALPTVGSSHYSSLLLQGQDRQEGLCSV